MKLQKRLGEILYALFGPNGADGWVHSSQTRMLAVYMELERHGLVKLVSDGVGGLKVERTCEGLKK